MLARVVGAPKLGALFDECAKNCLAMSTIMGVQHTQLKARVVRATRWAVCVTPAVGTTSQPSTFINKMGDTTGGLPRRETP
jgi:hypothetical protein